MAIDPRPESDPALPLAAGDEPAGVPRCLHDGTPVWLAAAEPDGPAGDRAQLAVTDAGGCVVGRATLRRVYGPRAVLWIEVDEAFWHRGLPGLLVATLRRYASASGISTLLATADVRDVRLIAFLCHELGARAIRDGSRVKLELACGELAALDAGDSR